jgi:hypothetical protein
VRRTGSKDHDGGSARGIAVALIVGLLSGGGASLASAADTIVKRASPECPAPDDLPAVPASVQELTVGRSTDARIRARPRWNDTGVRVAVGQSYRMTATGTWCDSSIETAPDGYTSKAVVEQGASRFVFNALTERFLRFRGAAWFALVCGLDGDRATFFAVQNAGEWTAPAPGSLGCFANDMSLMYGNNSGSVLLRIERIR